MPAVFHWEWGAQDDTLAWDQSRVKPSPAAFPARSTPGRGLRGPAAIKQPARRGAGRLPSSARAGAMREGLGAACEAARPRLCRLLRRILRPQPACGSRRARYSRRAGVRPGREAGGSERGPDSNPPWHRPSLNLVFP